MVATEADGRTERAREDRCRRMLQRRGFQLSKSRLRDPRAAGYGGYMIVDASTNALVASGDPEAWMMDLDEVEAWLKD